MKNLFKSADFWCFFTAIAEFLAFLVWGLNMHEGDAMGFALITVYVAIPITSLILCAILANKSLKSALILAILMVLIEMFLPFFVYGTFEISLSIVLSAVPCATGIAIGYFFSKRK